MNESDVALLICAKLASFGAVQVGSFPIAVNVEGSDIDIICTFTNQSSFIGQLETHFAGYQKFYLNTKSIRGENCVVCRFVMESIPVEVFGQTTPIHQQYAWRHLQVEHRLLTLGGDNFRNLVMSFRNKGLKTEQAFASAMCLTGDSYEALLALYNEPDYSLMQLLAGI